MKVRVSDSDHHPELNYAASAGNFAILGGITVTAPVSPSIWYKGQTDKVISWDATGTITNVKIEYKTSASGSYSLIVANDAGHTIGANTYTWSSGVADENSEDCYVRVSDANNYADSYGVSPSAFSIRPVITVTAPTTGDVIRVAASYSNGVKWNLNGSSKVSAVDVLYSTNGTNGPFDKTILTNVDAALGQCNWNVVSDTISSNVVVKVVDSAHANTFGLSNVFKIAGSITVTQPTTGNNWVVGSTGNNITWTKHGTLGNVNIYANYGSGYDPTPIGTADTSSVSSWNWNPIPDHVSNNVKIKIAKADDESVTYGESAVFSIAAGFTVNTPTNGNVLTIDSSYDITWDRLGSAVTLVKLEYSANGGTNWTTITSTATNSGTYPWTVPDVFTATGKIKVSDPNNANAYAVSSGFFKIQGSLTVTSPNNGTESWNTGSTYPITWTKHGSIASINFFYSANDGTDWTKINSNAIDASLGTWNWAIQDATPLTGGFHGLIKIVDASDATVYDPSNAKFEVKGAVNLVNPSVGGIDLKVGDIYAITWTKSGAISNVQIHYSTNGGIVGNGTYPDGNLIATVPASDLSYNWSVVDAIGNNLRIRVRDSANSTVWSESTNAFSIKGKVALNEPLGGQVWQVGDTHQIKWTPTGTYSQVKLEYSTNAFSDELQTFSIATIAAGASAVQQSYDWTVPDKIGNNIKVRVSDAANSSVNDVSTSSLTIKGSLVLTNPTAGLTWVVGDSNTVRWSLTGTIPTVKLEYTKDGSTFTDIAASAPGGSGTGSYAWTVADAISNTVQIRISDTRDSSVNNLSSAFIIKGSLHLSAPNNGEVWTVGTSQDIAWTKTGTFNTVKLEYSTNGFSNENQTVTITASTDATGTPSNSYKYTWTVPDAISSTVKVRITNNSDDTVKAISANNFKIRGNLTLTTPNGTEKWKVSELNNIVWTMVGTIQNVKLELSKDSGSTYNYTIIGSTPAGALTYGWTVPDQLTIHGRVKISDVSDSSVSDESNADFSIIAKFTLSAPNGGEVWVVNAAQDIAWAVNGTVNNVKLEYSTDSGSTFPYLIIASTPNNNAYTWTIPDAISSSVRVKVSDTANSDAYRTSAANFKIKGALTVTSPNNGTESWSAGYSYPINWTRTGSVASINAYYSSDNGQNYAKINGAALDGSLGTWSWPIPGDVTLSTQAKIKIVDASDSTVYDESNNTFEVKGGLVLNTPSLSGITLEVGTSYSVTWSKYGNISTAQLHYSTNGGIVGGGTYPDSNKFAEVPASDLSFTWAVPDAIGANLRVRIRDANNFNVWGESVNTFAIKGKLQVNTPNGGEIWFVGSSQNVTWIRTGSIPTVKLEYSTNGGSTYPYTIAPSVDASLLTYPWTIPDAIGANLKVKVTDISNSTVTDVSNNDFTIKGVLALSLPNGGETWVVGNTQNITWTRTGSIPTVKLEYSTNGGSTYPYTIVASTDASTGTYPWSVADAIGTQDRVRITDTSDSSVNDTSNNNFTVKGALHVDAPNGGEAWQVATVHNVTWTRSGSVANVKIQYSLDGGVSYPGTISNSTDASTGSFAWTIPDSPNTTVKVKISDALDNTVSDISDANFKIIGSLALTAPNNGTEKWGIGLSKKITWSMVGSIANVKLEYSTNSGTSYDYLIAASTPAGGLEYYWTIPDRPTTHARVKISDASDISVYSASANDFKIQGIFTITQPNGGEVWTVGDSQNITWNKVGSVPNVKLEYSVDGGAHYDHTISNSTSNTGTYAWTIPDAISATLSVRVSDVNDSEALDVSDANFKIRGSLTLGLPNGGEVWIVNSNHSITWTKNGSIPYVKLDYSTNGGTSYPYNIAPSLDAALGTYDWTVPDSIGSQLKVKVTATSDSTVYDESNNNFFIKGSLTISAPNGAEQWIVGTGHNITWARVGSIATAKLEYSKNSGGTFPNLITASTDASALSYSWAIPDDISTTLRVRITDTTDSGVNDMSNADFAIRGSLTIVSPNGGEIWAVGESHNITWTRVGSIVAVKLEYSTNGGTSYDTVITPSTSAATGSFAWAIPDAIGNQLRVRITDTSNSQVFDTSDNNFTVKGVLTLTSPNGGETWIVGASQNVAWTPTGTIPLVKLEYSTDGGNTYPNTIVDSTNGPSGTYAWTIPDAIGANLKVRVLNAADNSVSDVSNATFTVKGSLRVTAPNGGEAWGVATSHNITWVRAGSIATVKIEYSVDGGSNYNTINASADAGTGSYPWTIPDNLSSTAKVKITNNVDSSVNDASDANFKIVGILTVTAPNGGEAWSVNTNHNITWTRVGSIANVRIDYSTNGGTTYPNTITASSPAGALSFTWTIPDAVGTQVRVRISDASDITVADTSDANFTIQARFDITAPAGGEVWVVGSSHDITWNTIGSVTTVRLDYSTDGGSTYPNNITLSTANTGSFPWTMPDAISSQVRVKVSDYNNINAFGTSAANFKIRGSVTVSTPNGGEAWIVNSSHNITWSIIGSISNVKIEYSTDSGSSYPYTIIASTSAPAGTYAWTIPDNLSQTARVKVTDASDSIVYGTSNNNFKIRGNVTVTSPVGTEEWEVGSAHNVTWTRIGTVLNVKIEYSINGGSSYPYVIVGSTDASTGTYPWVIPDTITTQARVKVSDATDATVYNASNANFKIKGVVLVTSPNGSEAWEVASNHNITWSITGTIANLKLEYSTNGGSTYPNTIVPSLIASSGTYSWAVPDSIGSQLRVKATNLSDLNVYDTSDANFSIIGKLIVTAPNGGEVWPVGSAEAVAWSRIGSIANVKLEYSTDGGVTYPGLIVASTPANAGSYNWVVPDNITSTGRVKISDVSNSNVFDVSDGNFKIRGNLTLSAPNGSEVWLINSSHDVTWTRFGSITNARLDYSTNGGTTYPYTIIGSVDASLQRYSWIMPDNPSTLCRVKVSDASDATVFDASKGNFIIRGGFVLTSPNGGESWAVGASQNITWNTFGSIANIKLEYSIDNGSHWNNIIGSVSNTGVYAWTIPDAISANCIVRVSDVNDPNANDVSDAVFKIHGLLTVTSPNGGEEWSVGSSHVITWAKVGSITSARLDYSKDGGTTYPYLIVNPVPAGNLTYNWTVPDAISITLRVKISDSSDSTVYDTSDNNFKIKAAFTVTSPNGGQSWTVATAHNITWSTQGTVANVKLDYSTNAGSDWTVISDSYVNSGTYAWTVPDAISNQCRIKISDATDSSALDISDNNFKISGSLTLTAPNGGEKWAVGSTQIITWNRVGSIANVRLEYSDNNGISYVPIISSTPNAGSFAWTLPNAITTQAKVKISNVDDLTINSISLATFKIQAGFTVTSPNGGEAWLVGSSHSITWTWDGTVPNINLDYTINGGTSWIQIVSSYSNNGTYSWVVPDNVSGQVLVKVSDSRDSEAFDASNSNLRIRAAFTLTAPNGSEQWHVGKVYNITWANIGTIPNVKLQYSRDNFLTDTKSISASAPNILSFAWTIPDSISNTVRVRISDPNDIDSLDDSNADFKIIANFTVVSPNGGEKWDVASTHNVTWTSEGTIPQVKLEYSTDGGASYKIIAATDNTGSYEWIIPDDISAQFKVKVSDLADSTANDVSNANAKIRAKFTLNTPNGGQELTVGEDYNVTWACVGTVPNVKLDYSQDNFVTSHSIIASAPNTGSYTWKVPNAPGTTTKVRVMSTTDSDAYYISDSNFSIVVGHLSIVSPAGAERWITRETHNITWQTTSGTIPKVNIYYSKDNFVSDAHTVVSNLDNPTSSTSYAWYIPDDRAASVKVKVADIRDETVCSISNAFKIDYYTIYFELHDMVTNAALTDLTVNGASDQKKPGTEDYDTWKTSRDPNIPGANLGSPVTVQLPYGNWSLTWSKDRYTDASAAFTLDHDLLQNDLTWFNPNPEIPSKGYIVMETTTVHIWRANANYAYVPTTDTLSVSAWLERDGFVVTGTTSATVNIYDPSTGNIIKQLSGASRDAVGFFNYTWANGGLVGSKVYNTIVDIINAGNHYKTPGTFTVTQETKLQEVQDTVNSVLDKPISKVSQELQSALAGQTVIIQSKLDDQKSMIQDKMDQQTKIIVGTSLTPDQVIAQGGMIGMVQTTLSSFETRSNEAIKTLQAGANKAVEAGQALATTAMRYSWNATVAPNPALSNDTIVLSVQGPDIYKDPVTDVERSVVPMLTMYAADGSTIIANQPLLKVKPGLYEFSIKADSRFVPGKAYTYIMTESWTGGLVSGSGMVESMSITTIAGLASAAPEAERAAKKALDAIKELESVLVSGDNINIAMTLKNLKESVDNLPEVLSKEGPSAKLNQALNQITDSIKTLVGKEGLDIGTIMETALSSSPTIKQMRSKTDEINQVIDILMQLFEAKFGGKDAPILSTSLQPGSVKFRIVAVNPSKTRTQKVQVKNYLPTEVKPKDIADLGGLELEYDSEKSIYYVHKDDLELTPGEMRAFEVDVEDIWQVPEPQLVELRGRVDSIVEKLEKTPYYEKAKEIANTIYPRLDEIKSTQLDDSISRERHIGIYRENIITIAKIKEDIAKLEKLLVTAGGPLSPEMLKNAKIKGESPSDTMTWVVIFIMIIFVGLLAGVLFFTWHRQSRLGRDELLAAKKAAFPGQEEENKEQNKQEEQKEQ